MQVHDAGEVAAGRADLDTRMSWCLLAGAVTTGCHSWLSQSVAGPKPPTAPAARIVSWVALGSGCASVSTLLISAWTLISCSFWRLSSSLAGSLSCRCGPIVRLAIWSARASKPGRHAGGSHEAPAPTNSASRPSACASMSGSGKSTSPNRMLRPYRSSLTTGLRKRTVTPWLRVPATPTVTLGNFV